MENFDIKKLLLIIGDAQNHHCEEVIEENGDERLPHEDFYAGVNDYSVKQPFVPQAQPALSLYYAMAVVPGKSPILILFRLAELLLF